MRADHQGHSTLTNTDLVLSRSVCFEQNDNLLRFCSSFFLFHSNCGTFSSNWLVKC